MPMDMPEDIVITILVIPMIIALLYHFFGERGIFTEKSPFKGAQVGNFRFPL